MEVHKNLTYISYYFLQFSNTDKCIYPTIKAQNAYKKCIFESVDLFLHRG